MKSFNQELLRFPLTLLLHHLDRNILAVPTKLEMFTIFFFSVQRKKCLQFAPRNLLPLNIFSLQRCLSLTHSARADQRITEVYFARRRDGFRIDQICSIWYLNNIFNKLSKTFVLLQISDDP